jgi:hypothetical protein
MRSLRPTRLLALLLLASCAGPTSDSYPATGSGAPAMINASVTLHGPAANVPYTVKKKPGRIEVPAQISVPPGDSVRLTAGSKPQAGMPTVPLVPAATNQFVYTAVYFSKITRTQHGLALAYLLPAKVNPKVGTFYLAAFDRKTKTWNSNYATPIHATSREISMAPTGGAVTYPANTAIGIALYRISTSP